MGADLDARTLDGRINGRTHRSGVDVRANSAHYGLRPPCLLVGDVLRGLWRAAVWDAIVTDPPYGHRAAATVAAAADPPETAGAAPGADPVRAVLAGLLELAEHCLVPGAGRLVFWLPHDALPAAAASPPSAEAEGAEGEAVPPGVDVAVRELCASPHLRVEAVCIHRCSKRHTRYLVSMRHHRAAVSDVHDG